VFQETQHLHLEKKGVVQNQKAMSSEKNRIMNEIKVNIFKPQEKKCVQLNRTEKCWMH
jgi:hypothetical protein